MRKDSASSGPGESVSIEFKGRTYTGFYRIQGGMMDVEWNDRSKSVKPGAAPAAMAKIVLREIIEETPDNW